VDVQLGSNIITRGNIKVFSLGECSSSKEEGTRVETANEGKLFIFQSKQAALEYDCKHSLGDSNFPAVLYFKNQKSALLSTCLHFITI